MSQNWHTLITKLKINYLNYKVKVVIQYVKIYIYIHGLYRYLHLINKCYKY